jgi:hypothetical protein
MAAGFAPQAEDAEASRAILSPSSSAAQIAAAGQQMAHTLLRRMDSQDQAYYSHTGTHYPNMITPDAKDALGRLGLPTDLQSGGSFGGVPQVVNKGTTGTQPQVGAGAAPSAPTGATGKAKAPDGKYYYHDAQGNNLGLAP